jgi:hypothetical protein
VSPIPVEVLARVRARSCRRVAACIAHAMAETDTGFDQMAARLGVSEAALERRLTAMLNGTNTALDTISDMLFACGCELKISLQKSNEMVGAVVASEGERSAA